MTTETTTTTVPATVKVGPYLIPAPVAGDVIHTDEGRFARRLVACECPEFAAFRLESDAVKAVSGGRCVGPTCEVEVTGRSLQRRGGEEWVRVRLTWVHDGDEENTTSGGFMRVDRPVYVG